MGFMKDVAGPIVEGVFGLGGAALGARSADKAAEAQERASAEALRFQREQASRAEAAYKQRWLEQQAMRNALLKRYGIDIPELANVAPPEPTQYGIVTGRPNMGPATAAPGAVPRQAGLTIKELAMNPQLAEWNTFRRPVE